MTQAAECACPRCGYDQSGVVATWRDACPVQGVCSECGYAFEWSDVFNAHRLVLRGFFEHGKGLWQSWLWAMRTLMWVLVPPWFWGKVRLHHEPRVWRMVWWIPVWFGSVWSVVVALRLVLVVMEMSRRGLGGAYAVAEVVNAVLEPLLVIDVSSYQMSTQFYVYDSLLSWRPATFGLIAQMLFFPVLLLILPETRKRAKVRAVHVVRATVYGQAWVIGIVLMYLASAVEDVIWGAGGRVPMWGVWWALEGPLPIIFALSGWIALWWLCVLAMGFKVKRALWTWLVLMTPPMLILTIFVSQDHEVQWWLIQ